MVGHTETFGSGISSTHKNKVRNFYVVYIIMKRVNKTYNTQRRTDLRDLYADHHKKIKAAADEVGEDEYSSSDEDEGQSVLDLTIHPIKPDEEIKPFPEEIPEPLPGADGKPFVMVALGKRKSGKTTILNNMILKKHMWRKRFSQIVIISPTLIYDQTSRFLVDEAGKHNCFDKYNDSIIDDIIRFQEKKKKNEREHILIIADDIIGQMGRNSKIYNLSSRSRHYLISLVYLTQNLRSLSPVVRSNTTHWFLFRNPNMKEMEKICEEFAFLGSRDNVYRLYEYITNVPYNFMYIDDDYNVWENFQKKVWSKFNDDGSYAEEFGGGGGVEDVADNEALEDK